MEKLVDEPEVETTVEASASFVAQAVSYGAPRPIVLTPEQTTAFCALKANAQPPMEALRRAAAKRRRFQYPAR